MSNNNLSIKITSSGTQLPTFNASSYMGNPELCGSPLPEKFAGEEPTADQVPAAVIKDDSEEEGGFITKCLYYHSSWLRHRLLWILRSLLLTGKLIDPYFIHLSGSCNTSTQAFLLMMDVALLWEEASSLK
ncbi:hypothetical protein WN943_027780 [Citrus x changshan-huyou]